jgi:hypothetical protein
MRQLGDCHNLDPKLSLAMRLTDLLENLGDALTTTSSSDDDTRVEDQSHEDGFHGFRLWTIFSTSAAKLGSSVTA